MGLLHAKLCIQDCLFNSRLVKVFGQWGMNNICCIIFLCDFKFYYVCNLQGKTQFPVRGLDGERLKGRSLGFTQLCLCRVWDKRVARAQ